MEYTDTDLTRTSDYNPVKLSHVTNQNDARALRLLSANIRELEEIFNFHTMHSPEQNAIRLNTFFRFMNSGNRQKNAVAWKEGGVSNSLNRIDRYINEQAKKTPQLRTLCDVWNEGKTNIPSWENLLLTNHEAVINAYEEDARNATNDRESQYADHYLSQARKRLEQLKTTLGSDFQHKWYKAAYEQEPPKRGLSRFLSSFGLRKTGITAETKPEPQ